MIFYYNPVKAHHTILPHDSRLTNHTQHDTQSSAPYDSLVTTVDYTQLSLYQHIRACRCTALDFQIWADCGTYSRCWSGDAGLDPSDGGRPLGGATNGLSPECIFLCWMRVSRLANFLAQPS